MVKAEPIGDAQEGTEVTGRLYAIEIKGPTFRYFAGHIWLLLRQVYHGQHLVRGAELGNSAQLFRRHYRYWNRRKFRLSRRPFFEGVHVIDDVARLRKEFTNDPAAFGGEFVVILPKLSLTKAAYEFNGTGT